MVEGGVCDGGACMAGGMHGSGVSMAGGVYGRRCVWQGDVNA